MTEPRDHGPMGLDDVAELAGLDLALDELAAGRELPADGAGGEAAALAALAADQDATTVVAGLPVTMAGAEGPAARAVRAYLDELRPLLPGLVFELVDERLSTVAAERALVGGGVRRRDRRQVVDQVAASVFLQTWLDGRRRTGS